MDTTTSRDVHSSDVPTNTPQSIDLGLIAGEYIFFVNHQLQVTKTLTM